MLHLTWEKKIHKKDMTSQYIFRINLNLLVYRYKVYLRDADFRDVVLLCVYMPLITQGLASCIYST